MTLKKWLMLGCSVLVATIVLVIVTSFFSILALFFLQRNKLVAVQTTASLARVTLFPLQTITLFQSDSLQLIDLNLQLLQRTKAVSIFPSFFQQRWNNSQSPTQDEIDQLIIHTTQLTALTEKLNNLTSPSSARATPQPFLLKIFAKTQPQLFEKYTQAIRAGTQTLALIQPFITEYSSLTGFPNQTKTYLVMLQNNMELRPTGGFLGSYALVTFSNGNLQSFEVEDIYFPDGQLYGHVDPPQPLQEAFLQGFWKLRDANWHPDFSESARNVEWFFEEATIHEIDGVLAINFTTIEKMLEIVGPLHLPEFDQTVTADDIYLFLEIEGEKDFVPGSTKKRDLLTSLQKELLKKLGQLSPTQYLELAELFTTEMKQQEIQAFFHDPQLQTIATNSKIDGELQNQPCQTQNCFPDYFAIFDANLGVNKTNCCVERQVNVEKSTTAAEAGQADSNLQTTIQLHYSHLGPKTEAHKQLVGHYRNYVRIYVPANTTVQELKIGEQAYADFIQSMIEKKIFDPTTSKDYSISTVKGLSEIGFWTWVESGQELNVELETTTPLPPTKDYQLTLQKQSGTQDLYNYFTVQFNNRSVFDNVLEKDTFLPIPDMYQ